MKAIINFQVEKPDDVSNEDFRDWIDFETGNTNELSMDNPMANKDLEMRDMMAKATISFR